jgi:hypothetical protein
LGFIREEMQFSSVGMCSTHFIDMNILENESGYRELHCFPDDLIQRIRKDVEFMQTHLTTSDFETEKRNSFFTA